MPRRPSLLGLGSRSEVFPTVHFARDHLKADVAARVRRGEWLRVQPGAYVAAQPDLPPYAQRREFALARILATSTLLRAYDCFSHATAALIWGLPLARVPDRTHVIQRHTPSGRASRILTRHVLQLPAEHQAVHRGLRVTSLPRTVVDCAREMDPLEALTIADGALARSTSSTELEHALSQLPGLPGTARAARLLDLADSGAESPGETRTRFELLFAGFPRPETQIMIRTRLGDFWADLGWRRWRLLLEYDGRPKYDADGTEVLFAEKRRHDAIVEAGYRVLRVTKEDLRAPGPFVRRVAAHLSPGLVDPTNVPPVLRHR